MFWVQVFNIDKKIWFLAWVFTWQEKKVFTLTSDQITIKRKIRDVDNSRRANMWFTKIPSNTGGVNIWDWWNGVAEQKRSQTVFMFNYSYSFKLLHL